MQDNPTSRPAPDPSTLPDNLDRRRILIAASVVGGVLLFFALTAVVIFLFRYQLMPDPWKVL